MDLLLVLPKLLSGKGIMGPLSHVSKVEWALPDISCGGQEGAVM